MPAVYADQVVFQYSITPDIAMANACATVLSAGLFENLIKIRQVLRADTGSEQERSIQAGSNVSRHIKNPNVFR